MNLRKLRKWFSRDEKAQATFEYILMIAIAVILAVLVIKNLIVPTFNYLSNRVGDLVQRTLFNQKNMHQIRLRK